MQFLENDSNSNYFTKEIVPGSGRFHIFVKDVTKYYRGFTYGFFLDYPDDFSDEFSDELINAIKPHLTYKDFDYGKVFSVKSAIGAAPWMALSVANKTLLSQCQLIKVGEAHILLRYNCTQSCH